MFDYTRQIKCDKTTKIFSLNKVLFNISVPFSLQSDDTAPPYKKQNEIEV